MIRRAWRRRGRWLRARYVRIRLHQAAQDAGEWIRPSLILEDRRVWRWQRPTYHAFVINHEPEGYPNEPPEDWAP